RSVYSPREIYRDLRTGAVRSPGLRGVAARAGHREHVAESGFRDRYVAVPRGAVAETVARRGIGPVLLLPDCSPLSNRSTQRSRFLVGNPAGQGDTPVVAITATTGGHNNDRVPRLCGSHHTTRLVRSARSRAHC